MREFIVLAETENLKAVLEFIESELENCSCSIKDMMQIQLAVEEIFVNIVNYAYDTEGGKVKITFETENEPFRVVIKLEDSGKRYNPLLKDDPDITKSAEDREVGGLGIFLTKKVMDEVEYVYENGNNVLILKKIFKIKHN